MGGLSYFSPILLLAIVSGLIFSEFYELLLWAFFTSWSSADSTLQTIFFKTVVK